MDTGSNFQKIEQSFGWEPNNIIYNPNISMKAKGLWLYMNAKPNGWHFAAKRIADECTDGIDSIQAGLRELIEAGLLEAKKQGDGRFFYKLLDGDINLQKQKAPEVVVKEKPDPVNVPMPNTEAKRVRPVRSNFTNDEEFEKAFYEWNSAMV